VIIHQQDQPPVSVQRHQPNLEDPAAAVWSQIESFAGIPPTCLFLNPIATVTCDAETPGFLREARHFQADWCKRYKELFGRRVVKSVKNWASWKDLPNRDARYWDRAASFTGLLFINDTFVPPHQWTDRKGNLQNVTDGSSPSNDCVSQQ
jgi:hypothetical protein